MGQNEDSIQRTLYGDKRREECDKEFFAHEFSLAMSVRSDWTWGFGKFGSVSDVGV